MTSKSLSLTFGGHVIVCSISPVLHLVRSEASSTGNQLMRLSSAGNDPHVGMPFQPENSYLRIRSIARNKYFNFSLRRFKAFDILYSIVLTDVFVSFAISAYVLSSKRFIINASL